MILLNDLKYVIENNVARYPKMQPQDVVKLTYQHVFGNGHLVNERDVSLDFLKKEYETVKFSHQGEDLSKIPFAEHLGNWYSRVNLLRIENEEQLETLNDVFIASAKLGGGNVEYFLSRLYFLREVASYGMFEFSYEEMDEYLAEYERLGYPPVHHSTRYKEFYDPAYRVIDTRYIRLFPLIERIRKLLSEKEKVVVAIDGKSGSGKSFAAELLAFVFDASVIHMDDFFLPPEKRTKERYEEPGGNVHYERFRDEVARYIKKNEDFSYRRFDCSIMNYGAKVDIEAKPLMIVEGVYSQHIQYRSIYDLKVFFDIDEQMQANSIYQRDGARMYEMFRNVWIPLENMYFEKSEIKDKSHMVVNFE